MPPHDLLQYLKEIESELGRDFGATRNGPRPVDLDILYYNDIEFTTPTLVIPHPRILEREFVLRPLTEYNFFANYSASLLILNTLELGEQLNSCYLFWSLEKTT